jgi:hypothetical protein
MIKLGRKDARKAAIDTAKKAGYKLVKVCGNHVVKLVDEGLYPPAIEVLKIVEVQPGMYAFTYNPDYYNDSAPVAPATPTNFAGFIKAENVQLSL